MVNLLPDAILNYLQTVTVNESPILRELHDETMTMSGANMQISAEQGQFMAFLVKLINAKRILEIGTYTGYSALVMAQALPDDGEVVTCDIDPKATSVAKRYWEKAGLSHRINLKLGPALETLASLASAGVEPFDVAFIDADKKPYPQYFEACYERVRTGGLIMIDNMLWDGKVADKEAVANDKSTGILHELNQRLTDDARVMTTLVPIRDGLLLCLKL